MVRFTFYSITAVYGENEYGKSGHLSIFTISMHLMMLLKYTFFRASFLHPTKDTAACRAMHLIFFKVETLLNNAFNEIKKKKKIFGKKKKSSPLVSL